MITPANYGPYITNVNTALGQIYAEIDVNETSKEWSSDEPMTGGSIWSTGWTGVMPKARPWFGSRVVHEPAPQTYQVEPIPYELTYGIDQFIRDDSSANAESIFWRFLPDMMRQWRRKREYDLRDLLEAGGILGTTTRQRGPDGLSNFNTAHPIDIYNPNFNLAGTGLFSSGVYCNDFTSGGQTIDSTLIGGALGVVSFTTLLAYMGMIPGEDGEVLGVMPDALMVPSTLNMTAQFILQATLLASPTWGGFTTLTSQVGTADNVMRKQGVRIIVNKFLRNTTRWYLMDTSHAKKPLLYITREAPRIVPRTNPNDPNVFDAHRLIWGGWSRDTPAWNYAWLMARSGP
jgi:phage major head subunit gpT-like protein